MNCADLICAALIRRLFAESHLARLVSASGCQPRPLLDCLTVRRECNAVDSIPPYLPSDSLELRSWYRLHAADEPITPVSALPATSTHR